MANARTLERPPALSIFSGAGGLDLGASWAGCSVEVCVEKDPDACRTLEANGARLVIGEDVRNITGQDLLEAAKLRRGEPVILLAGPPCTPFSKSGFWLEEKRSGRDPDAYLLDEVVRVVRSVRPAALVFESVPGLSFRTPNYSHFERLLTELDKSGYEATYGLLNAADFGVPQTRVRLFVLAGRDRCPLRLPTPERWPWKTARQAIGHLEGRDDLREPGEDVNGSYGHLLPEVPPGSNYLHFTAERGHPSPKFGWRSRYWNFLLKLDPTRPSWTIQSHPGPYAGPFHWENRRLRLPEVKLLQGFPEGYRVTGSRRSAQVQLGNAVPPLLSKAVVRAVVRQLGLTLG